MYCDCDTEYNTYFHLLLMPPKQKAIGRSTTRARKQVTSFRNGRTTGEARRKPLEYELLEFFWNNRATVSKIKDLNPRKWSTIGYLKKKKKKSTPKKVMYGDGKKVDFQNADRKISSVSSSVTIDFCRVWRVKYRKNKKSSPQLCNGKSNPGNAAGSTRIPSHVF